MNKGIIETITNGVAIIGLVICTTLAANNYQQSLIKDTVLREVAKAEERYTEQMKKELHRQHQRESRIHDTMGTTMHYVAERTARSVMLKHELAQHNGKLTVTERLEK